MIYKNTKAMVCLNESNTTFFDRVTGVLQQDTVLPNIFTMLPR